MKLVLPHDLPYDLPPPPPEGWPTWLAAIYQRLLNHFGFRHWWPAQTDFEIIVGAFLTQNVAWRNVELALANLRRAGLLEPAAMDQAPLELLEPCLRPAGYFRQKAQRLQGLLHHLHEHYGGSLPALLARPATELRPELLALKGVGPETADSILCYAARAPVMVMDAYTRRVFHRLGAFADADIPYAAMQAFFHQLDGDQRLYGDFHAQIVALGNRYCRKRNPDCGACPLADVCPRQGVDARAGDAAADETAVAVPPAADEVARLVAGFPLPVHIEYRNKKHSSGRIDGGEARLCISSRLPRREQVRHVRHLLTHLAQRQEPAPPPGLTPSDVNDDAALAAWAQALNRQHFGFSLRSVRFRTQQRRWGSCSGGMGAIHISHRLRGGPRQLLEYVLVHELCHLRELNHGPRFWQLVARALPDYQERRLLLRRYERWLAWQPGG